MKKEMMILGIVLIISLNLISAETNVCCEKTKGGAWCQTTLESECDTSEGYRVTPTSCESTSFCKKGCCIDEDEGNCMINTPEKVCENEGGSWQDDSLCSLPACNLGCCILGDEASFVTLTRCKHLANLYGLQTDFRSSITDTLTCIETANAQDKGACVIENEAEFEKTCKVTTRGECKDGTFYNGKLCTNPELQTTCGKTTNTVCVEGKDEVYFVDSCGNVANIYDASKVEDELYWSEIFSKESSCAISGAGDKKCGNCDYFKGTICQEGKATYGDHSCKDLSCQVEIDGEKVTKKNGESWCYYDANIGKGADPVGSRHYRYLCLYGEVTIEPCADFRNEICIEDTTQTSDGEIFHEAACRANRWRDCVDQESQEDCENNDKRDCYWVEGVKYLGAGSDEESTSTTSSSSSSSTTSTSTETFSGGKTTDSATFEGGKTTASVVAPITGNSIFGGDDDEDEEDAAKTSTIGFGGGICLPSYPPGFKFWEDGDAKSICGLLTATCVVKYSKSLIGEKECIENCECINPEYAPYANQVCSSMGDCGAYVNWVGEYTNDGIELRGEKDQKIEWEKHALGKTANSGIMSEVKSRAGV